MTDNDNDFIYWRHILPCGVKLEEISGGEAGERGAAAWRALAYQVWAENGAEGFRYVDHTDSGAPLLEGSQSRISISHTKGMLVVATLPRTPECDLATFHTRTALGVDTERADREKTIAVRDKFLSQREQELVDPESVAANVTAWTAKEALYKAALMPGIDFRNNLRIIRMPEIDGKEGEALITGADGRNIEMNLASSLSDGFIITVAYSPKCAKFKKS